MRKLIRILACFCLLATGCAGATELVVIVHPASGIDALSKDEVINIFMGRYRTLPSGARALTMDAASRQEKSAFYSALVGKELSQIDSYWARLRFSGQGQPPRTAASTEEAIAIVSSNKGAIAYIDKNSADKRIKVVYELPAAAAGVAPSGR